MAKMRSRRHVLGLAGTVALAGCSNLDDSSDESIGDANTEGAVDDTNESNGTSDDADNSGDDTESDDDLHAEYDTTEVQAVSADGDDLESVTAAIAETDEELVRGLSETEDLPDDRGMLFVYDEDDQRQFVMRDMDFGIDIIYADSDGTITGIHHAPAPREREEGSHQVYVGHGEYVLETVYDWTVDHEVHVGDTLEFDLES
ncbi:DUF192 domain-containing protein [Natronolimnobius baerhuensis]|uniref:DUF192 domain-containing protein n=1 Tax=Natronolimnobius baerhuensis TaxID=253108 RepID=A0A202E542_9EURY|nr:DUF192 domain-containing protein [Natronolimnobius baerhuensis]OVE83382.1 hypothetical protein B2G88_13045 [Natronolimnobius baerhuensis]